MVNLSGVGPRCLPDFLCLIAAANSHLFLFAISVMQTLLVLELVFFPMTLHGRLDAFEVAPAVV